MASEIAKSIQFICDEKGLDYEIVMDALQTALAAAYRKDFGNKQQNVQVIFDPETGDIKAWDEKIVVEDMDLEQLEKDQEELAARREKAREEERELEDSEVEDLLQFNPKNEMMLAEAKEHDKKAKVGDTLKIDLEVPGEFGRMAAQTAKQVIIQKLREAERNVVFADFKNQEGHVVQGVVQRRDRNSGGFLIDLGKITGVLAPSEMVPRERYNLGSRMKFYVMSVEMGTRGPEIMLSRKDNRMVETVFVQEIPEIASEEVLIKGIARDPGNRSKVSVFTDDESIDPIGACIGQRGSRITTIIDELGGEKIDVIQYSDDAVQYIKHALSPAKVDEVELNDAEKEATAKVATDQFSLAIGRGGQNVRLAADLTGWKIKVVDLGGGEEVSSEDESDDVEKKLSGDKADEGVEDVQDVENDESVEEKVEEVADATAETAEPASDEEKDEK